MASKLDFVFFDAGGGHRSAANALKLAIERQRRPWEVRLLNLQETLDSMDVFRKLTGLRLQDIYNLMLKKGWTLGSPQLMAGMQLVIRLLHRKQVRMLEPVWKERRPDLVVSLVPNFNRAIGESLGRALPGTPWLTVLTDIADYPPHLWIERESDYLVCGSDRAAAQARAAGHPEDHVFRTSGMILHPRFYEQPPFDRDAERRKLGLRANLPTGLVLFGGQGSGVMREIARRLDDSNFDLQLILICGHNLRLYRALSERGGRLPRHVVGFTTEVPYFMRLADFFIGKPGPGSISEALAMRLPVIVERNAFTLPQERYNAEWIVEHGVGLVVPNFRHIDDAVRRLLAPTAFAGFRERAAAIENRAVFEIPDILAKLLETAKP